MGVFDSVKYFENEPPATPSLGDTLSQGLRSGGIDVRGKVRRFAGEGMNAVGLDGSNQVAESIRDQHAAQEAAVGLPQLSDVHDVSSGLRYAAGTIGQMIPVGAAAIGAGLLTRGRAPMLAGTAAIAPNEIGAQLQRQDADPANANLTSGERLATAVPVGVGRAAIQNAVPTSVTSRLVGNAEKASLGRIAARGAFDIPANAAAGGLTEGLAQTGDQMVNPNAHYNPEAIKEASIEGGAAGGIYGMLGAAGHLAHSAGGSIAALPGRAKDAVAALVPEGVQKRAGEAVDASGDVAEKVADWAKGSIKQRTDAVKSWGADLLADPNLTDTIKAKVKDAIENPGDTAKGAWLATEAFARDAADKAKNALTDADVPTKLRSLYAKTKDAASGLMDKMAGGEEIADPAALHAAGDDVAAQGKVFEAADKTAFEKAKEWATKLSTEHLGEEKTAQLHTAMQDLSDKVNQQTVAALAKGQEALQTARDAVTRFADAVKSKVGEDASSKKSYDYSGVRQKIGEAVTGVLGTDHPAMQDPASLAELADTLRPYIEQVASGKAFDSLTKLDQLTKLYYVTGEKTSAVLKAVHDAVGEPAKDKAAFFNALNQIDAIHKGQMSIHEAQMKNLRPELQGHVRPSELRTEADMLGKWAQSKTRTEPGELAWHEAQVRAALQHRYGDKAEVVLAAVEKNMKREQNVVDLAQTSERTTEDQTATVKHYAQNKQLYLSPEHDKGSNGFEGAATQRIKTAQKNDPTASVQFRKASEIGLDDPMVKAKHADLMDKAQAEGMNEHEAKAHADKEIDKYGVVTAESTKQETALTSGDLKQVSLDAKKFGSSPSRIDAGEGVILDAVKLTEFMNKKLSAKDDYIESDNLSSRHRAARMFKEGVAAATDRLGHSFEVPDDTQITRSGLTWGEAKKLDMATEKDKASDATTKRINELRAEYKGAKTPRERKEIADEGKKLVGEKQWEVIREQAAEGRAGTDDTVDSGKSPPDPFGNVHEALKGGDDPAAVIRTNSGGEPRGDTVMGRRKPAVSVGDRPDPKAVAAKQAAFTEKARSGDQALLKKIDTESDPKSLQRAAEHLASLKDAKDANVSQAVDRINARLTDLVAEPGVAYGMQTKKYSMQGVDAREISYDDFLANNGSGESAASQEAINRRDQERARGQARVKVDKYGVASPMFLAVDSKPAAGEVILQRGIGRNEWTVLDSAPDVGKAAAARAMDAASKFDMSQARYDKTATDPGATHTSSVRAEIEAHIDKVLGPKMGVEWANILHAGEFDRTAAGDIIRLSVHALNPMGVAYHESLHGFFARLSDTKQSHISDVLERAGNSAPVMNQLKKLLANEPGALKQLADPEERAAYMYQFWAQGKLTVGPQVKSLFERIAKFIRSVTGLWTNDERAENIMAYFHSGEFEKNRSDPNAVNQALMETGASKAIEKLKAMTEPFREMGEALASAGGARLRDTGIPALRDLADAMKLQTTKEGTDTGYLPTARAERARRMNDLMTDLKPYKQDVLNEALEAMQNGTKANSLAARTVAKIVDKRLADALTYMQDAGVNIKALGMKDGAAYFPRAWDASYISGHQKEFLSMVSKYVASGEYKGDPKALMQKLMVTDGAEFNVEVDKPGMQNAKERVLSFIDHADAAPFMNKNMYGILNSYMTQATRRAEWARRFSDDGSGIKTLLTQAEKEGATPQQLDAAQKFVRSVDGTLGDTINPTARRMMGNVIVYQNLRLLPLAIFSSAVDSQGIMVRGGTVGEAFGAFVRGMKEVTKNFKKDPGIDRMTQLAETLGVVDSAMLVHTLGASYSQGMVGNRGRAINDTFFRLNLMEQYNTSMRVGATEAAMNFLVRHSTKPGEHSERFLGELGLKASDVQLDGTGRPKLLESDGLSLEHSAKMKAAVNRWVDGAVLRPDAVDKPIWMSDPHYALVAHLKQFVFSFHETILKRVVHEAKLGNYSPAMSLASYVPMMIAADALKGLIQGGGSQPSWKESWGPGDYAWSGMERAGLFGVGQFGLDMLGDVKQGGNGIGALSGPTVDQLIESLKTLGGHETFKTFAIHSLPANALYATALKGEATDPKFAD